MGTDEPIQPNRKGGGWFGVLGWVGLALVAYVLSAGPVVRYYDGRRPPVEVVKFYAPLDFLAHSAAPITQLLDWYVNLWRTKP